MEFQLYEKEAKRSKRNSKRGLAVAFDVKKFVKLL